MVLGVHYFPRGSHGRNQADSGIGFGEYYSTMQE